MMTKNEKLELATLIAEAVVKAMKAETANPVSANKGRKSATANEGKKTTTPATKHSMKLADYEPKKNDGFYNWASYKAKRTDYCYAVATNGKYLGCYENGKKVVEFADIEKKYNEAKKKYEAKFVYIKKENR